MYLRLKRIHDFAVFNANIIEYFAFFDDDHETKWLTSATCKYCAKQAAIYRYACKAPFLNRTYTILFFDGM